MITVTDAAAEQIKATSSGEGMENLVLRLSARHKSDGSLDYLMGFDEPKENDLKFLDNGVDMIVTEDEEDVLAGTIIDFVEMTKGQFNFIFSNPSDANYTPPPKSFKA